MKEFWEKLRDLLYDSTDYIIILAVIVGVVFIINWRLDGLFAKDKLGTNDSDEIIENVEDDSEEVNDTEIKEDNKEEVIVHLDIPSGSVLSQIAELLANKDLIQDEKEFVDKAVELEFDTKLRYGEFDIPKGSSLEEILNILAK